MVLLGDSVAVGIGAADPADTIGARLAARVSAAGVAVAVSVVAVSGARSDALAGQAARAVAAGVEVAVVIIGANDLTHFTPPPLAAAQLADTVRVLRAAGAAVVVVPAPDLSVVAWVPPNLRVVVRAASQALQRAQRIAAHAAGAVIVDFPTDIPTDAAGQVTGEGDVFSADRFYPSSAGYALLADVISPAVLAAVHTARGNTQ